MVTGLAVQAARLTAGGGGVVRPTVARGRAWVVRLIKDGQVSGGGVGGGSLGEEETGRRSGVRSRNKKRGEHHLVCFFFVI